MTLGINPYKDNPTVKFEEYMLFVKVIIFKDDTDYLVTKFIEKVNIKKNLYFI